jgi:hypothetical protein
MVGKNRRRLSTALKESRKISREGVRADNKLRGVKPYGNNPRSRKSKKTGLEANTKGEQESRRDAGIAGEGSPTISQPEKSST